MDLQYCQYVCICSRERQIEQHLYCNIIYVHKHRICIQMNINKSNDSITFPEINLLTRNIYEPRFINLGRKKCWVDGKVCIPYWIIQDIL